MRGWGSGKGDIPMDTYGCDGGHVYTLWVGPRRGETIEMSVPDIRDRSINIGLGCA